MKSIFFLAVAVTLTMTERLSAYENFSEAWALIHGQLLLQDQSAKGLSRDLSRRIAKDYGYRVECERGFLQKLSDVKCARGLRSFSEALYRSKFPNGKGSKAVLQIVIVASSSFSVGESDEVLTLHLPYMMGSDQMANFVTSVMLGDGYKKRLFLYFQFQDGLGNLQANVSVPIRIDDDLSVIEKWKALTTLTALAKEDLYFFEGPEESIFVTKRFQKAHENKTELQLDLQASASYDEMKQALTEPSINLESLARLSALEKGRVVHDELIEEFKKEGLVVGCSQLDDLTMKECLMGLQTFASFLKDDTHLTQQWPPVLIVSTDESAKAFDLLTNPQNLQSLLAVRFDFRAKRLKKFAQKKGWSL